MASATRSEVIRATFFMVYKGQGFSETYIIDEDNYPDAEPKAQAIMNARAALMPLGCTMDWARISKESVNRDSRALIVGSFKAGTLLSPVTADTDTETALEASNNVSSGLMYRFDGADGEWGNRLIRCVRDSWVTNQWIATVAATTPAKTDAPVALAAGMTMQAALNHYLIAVMNNSVIFGKSGIVDQPYRVTPIDQCRFRGVRKRDTGAPFGVSAGRRKKLV